MVDVYIQAGLRTPIGLFQNQYASTRPEYLGAAILNALRSVIQNVTLMTSFVEMLLEQVAILVV